jgi:hypothetical protein
MTANRARDHAAARDHVRALAKSDPKSALQEARTISDPWYRAQALASVARFAADTKVEEIAVESLAACAECTDPYKRLAAAAWPLRALIERGAGRRAREVLETLIDHELEVEPPSSRSEALFHLFQACFALDPVVRESLVGRLVSVHRAAAHWRSRRNLIDALSMLRPSDPELADRITASVDDERVRRRVADGSRPQKPREFFW